MSSVSDFMYLLNNKLKQKKYGAPRGHMVEN